MELNFIVYNQTMIRINDDRIASDSVNFLTARFKFVSDEWTNKTKTALFNGYPQILTDDRCRVPWEALQSNVLNITVFGVENDVRETTNAVKVHITTSGYKESMIPAEPTPTVYEQLLEKIDKMTVGEISPESISNAVEEYMASHPANGISMETLEELLLGYAKTKDIPKSLPASDVREWAKEETKPIYTAEEIGAAPKNHDHDDRYCTKEELESLLSEEIQNGVDGIGITNIAKTSTSGLVDTYTITYSDNTVSTFTITNGVPGEPGNDGKSVELRKTSTYIQWRLAGASMWNDLISLSEIKGTPGEVGADGVDGKNVELQKTSTHIQWRLMGESIWNNLVALSDIKGDKGDAGSDGRNGSDGEDGKSIELRTTSTHIQWRLVGTSTWNDLVALSDIKGSTGARGIQGEPGKSAYQLAVENDFSGTLEQWLESLKGVGADEIYIGVVEPDPSEGYKVWINPEAVSASPEGGSEPSMTLLWTNTANIKSGYNYPPTTVDIDLTGYTSVKITFYVMSGYSSTITQECIIDLTDRIFIGGYDTTESMVMYYDRLVKPTNTGVQFFEANANGVVKNNACVPYKIYGVK